MEQGSVYSAAWSSAFDWGSKGPEFKSPYPDHFFCPNGQKNMKPEKASLHAPQVRFMAQRAASDCCVLDTPEACKTQSAS